MNILTRGALRVRAAAVAAYRALTLEKVFELGLANAQTHSGVAVTQENVLTLTAYWNGLNVIAGDVGLLDRILYRRLKNDDRERASDLPLYRLVHDAPNPMMTAMTLWQTLQMHALAWGNGYAEIEWDNALRPIGLWPVTPDAIAAKTETVTDARGRSKTRLYYLYNGQRRIEAEDMLHIPGLGFDGITGYSVVSVLRESLGLSVAAERFGAQFFGEGGWPGMVFEKEGTLGKDAYERLLDGLNRVHQPAAGGRAHRTLILEDGLKAGKPPTIPPEDAQALETRQFQVEEMCRILNLPPHKLKHKVGERPGGNIEASQIDYLQGTLLPWTTRIEQELNRKLISKTQEGVLFFEHNFPKLLRVDVTTRVAAEEKWIGMGVLTPEYVAKVENFPKPPKPEPKPEPVPVAAPMAPPPAPPEPPPAAARMSSALRDHCLERMAQYVRREAARVKQAATKEDPQAFAAWVGTFYEREAGVLSDTLRPLITLRAASTSTTVDPEVVSRMIATAHTSRSREALMGLSIKDLSFEAERLAQGWERVRPGELADQIMGLRAEEM